MMLGLLFARAGIPVVVLEKHRDFFRDFRGDTIHPSTIDLMDQLGLRSAFAAVPQSRVDRLDAVVNGTRINPINFRLLLRGARYLALMPQWDFLDLLATAARELPDFRLIMEAEATDLLRDGDRVTGVTAQTADGPLEVAAELTIAADGRSSTLRAASGLPVTEFGVPIDVLWFRLPRPAVTPRDTLGYLTQKTMLVTIPRTDYFQTALLIAKGSFDAVRARGLENFRAIIAEAAPFLESVVHELTSWDDVKLLSVQINRLDRWHLPGFLAIGDAAHAMSPAFGVGINYAIQDAVATANLLVPALRRRSLTEADLASVESRRARPARRMQAIQLRLHTVVARPGGAAAIPSPLPGLVRVLLAIAVPPFRLVTAHLIGRGFRPERISRDVLGK